MVFGCKGIIFLSQPFSMFVHVQYLHYVHAAMTNFNPPHMIHFYVFQMLFYFMCKMS